MAKKKLQAEGILVSEEELIPPAGDADEGEDQLSPIGVLVGVMLRPRATFQQLRDAVVGHWWVVAVVAVMALALSTITNLPIAAEAASNSSQAQIEGTNSTQELSEEEQAQVEQVQEIFSSHVVLGSILGCVGVFGLAISYLVRAGFVFLLGLALGGRASFKQVWRMAVWTTLPEVLRNIVSTIVTIMTGNPAVSGLSYALTSTERSTQPYLSAILGAIDIYLLWSLVLLWIGLLVTSQLSRAKSALVTLSYWLFGLTIIVGSIAVGQAITNMFTMG